MFVRDHIKIASKIIFSLAFLGFISCVVHIVPQLSHSNSTTSHNDGSNQVACVDHEVSISGHRDQNSLDITTIALAPTCALNFNIAFSTDETPIVIDVSKSPPDKIALYIKHNTLLL